MKISLASLTIFILESFILLIFLFEGPRCNGYPKTEWDCCNPTTKCGEGEGDCDTDDDCVGDLICGSSRDKSNNCKNEFANSASFWMDKADCCTQPGTTILGFYTGD